MNYPKIKTIPKAVRESVIEKHLCARINQLGGTPYKFTSPNRRSVPDRMCVLPTGLVVFIECKAPNKALTKAQIFECQKLIEKGHSVFSVDTISEVEKVFKVLKKLIIDRKNALQSIDGGPNDSTV